MRYAGISLSSKSKMAVSSRFRSKSGSINFNAFVHIVVRIFALNGENLLFFWQEYHVALPAFSFSVEK